MASRSSYWIRDEIETLVEYYVEHGDILFEKLSNKITQEEKERKFCDILESWKRQADVPGVIAGARVFGLVARRQGSVSNNFCHLFCELDPTQPASAIVDFATKVMIGQSKEKS